MREDTCGEERVINLLLASWKSYIRHGIGWNIWQVSWVYVRSQDENMMWTIYIY